MTATTTCRVCGQQRPPARDDGRGWACAECADYQDRALLAYEDAKHAGRSDIAAYCAATDAVLDTAPTGADVFNRVLIARACADYARLEFDGDQS